MKEEVMMFRGRLDFLSNFYSCQITDKKGVVWPSSEHLYQALKYPEDYWERIRLHPGKGLKNFLRSLPVTPRDDWDRIKVDVMRRILMAKFIQNPDLLVRLKAIPGDIVEGNYWHDNFWGNCYCNKCSNKFGENHLGHLLMKIRDMKGG